MAHIEQTKKGSRKSGGPQYYLQDLAQNSGELLSRRRKCPVRLWTVYGIVETGLVAVSKSIGSVGHDRLQRASKGARTGSIAEQVAYWYKLKSSDIETIEFDDSLDQEAFVICPTRIRFFKKPSPKRIEKDSHPLTLTNNHRSQLILDHLKSRKDVCTTCRPWAGTQIRDIVAAHASTSGNVDERDLLRASGALNKLGIHLGLYRSKGIDCEQSAFQLGGYPPYPCPIEIEESSQGFLAKHHDAHRRQRLVVLCLEHNAPQVLHNYVDVIELRELARVLREIA